MVNLPWLELVSLDKFRFAWFHIQGINLDLLVGVGRGEQFFLGLPNTIIFSEFPGWPE